MDLPSGLLHDPVPGHRDMPERIGRLSLGRATQEGETEGHFATFEMKRPRGWDGPRPDAPVFLGGEARPNAGFQAPCKLAGIKPRFDVETGKEEP